MKKKVTRKTNAPKKTDEQKRKEILKEIKNPKLTKEQRNELIDKYMALVKFE